MELIVNGVRRQVDSEPDRTLLTVLRDELDLTGTKYGCGEGQCGACTVLIAGAPARSCQIRAAAVKGRAISTIEGLASNGRLHPLQEAFLEMQALQCGYCTSGMLMSGAALLEKTPHPTREQIVSAMQGNICRCGTYPRIIAAVQAAASRRKGAAA